MKTNSIFFRLFTLFLIFTILLVGALWILQVMFLPDYYEIKKTENIKKNIIELDQLIDSEHLSQQALDQIADISERLNGRIVIYDFNGNILHFEGSQGMMRELRITREQIEKLKTDKIIIYKNDVVRGNNEFLAVLYLGSGFIYHVLTPFQAIEDAVSITRGFYFFLVLTGVVISSFMAWIFAKRITKPLLELNVLAGEIASLNFGKKWERERKDEIGELGSSLNKLSQNLEKKIKELKIELEKEKNLDKLRKNFVSRVSHELQTPIAIINGHIEALNDGIPQTEDDKKEYLKIIEKETLKMSVLIKDLLDLTQLESGVFRINYNKFSYLDLLAKKIEGFGLLVKDKKIVIEQKVDSDEIVIYGDEFRIDQVLNNFLQNAVNNTAENGKIILSIFDSEDLVRTEIFNTGNNIPEEIMMSIWEPFFKGEEKKGTGIGLAIVKNIIELHGGNVSVENLKDGVSFSFTIPKTKKE